MIYGIGAALGWGLADLLAALAGRRAGSIRTAFVAQLFGVIALTLLIPVGHPQWSLSAPDFLVMLGVGVVAAVGYLAIYAALTAGPLALVSPIVAAYSAFVIALSMIVLHEHLSAVALTGASVVIAGVALASSDFGSLSGRVTTRGRGVQLALVAMLAFGAAAFGLGRYAKEFGWFLSAYVARIGTLAVVAMVFATITRERPAQRSGGWLSMAIAAGVLDVGATVSFVLGSQAGLVSLVAAASATYPLVPVVVGMRMFHERIAATQLVGILTVVAGLVVLAFR